MKQLILIILCTALYGIGLGLIKGIKSHENVKLSAWWSAWGYVGGISIATGNPLIGLLSGIAFLVFFHFSSYVKRCFFCVFNITEHYK